MGVSRILKVAFVAAVSSSAIATVSAEEAVKKSASKPGLPILTLSGTYDFVKSSVFLTMDLVSFSTLSFVDFAMQQLPPEQQKQIFDMYDDAIGQVETLRIQNGIPSYAGMKKDALKEWEKTVQPQVDTVWKMVKGYATTPNKILKSVISKFEKEYPASKGMVSADVFDFSLTILFLVYYVLDFFISMFFYFCCCGMCSTRKKKGTPSAVSSKPAAATASKKKK